MAGEFLETAGKAQPSQASTVGRQLQPAVAQAPKWHTEIVRDLNFNVQDYMGSKIV